MSLDSIISLLLGVPIGLVSGLYTGLIVTRYSRFSDLRNEVLRIIRAIDYMGEQGYVKVSNNENVSSLSNIASDLYFLKHKEAGDCVSSLLININSSTNSAQRGQIDNVEFGRQHALWQKNARELTPSKKILWAIWGNI